MQYDLGYFDMEQKTLQPLDNPFGTMVVTHVFGTFRYLCLRARQGKGWRATNDDDEQYCFAVAL